MLHSQIMPWEPASTSQEAGELSWLSSSPFSSVFHVIFHMLEAEPPPPFLLRVAKGACCRWVVLFAVWVLSLEGDFRTVVLPAVLFILIT